MVLNLTTRTVFVRIAELAYAGPHIGFIGYHIGLKVVDLDFSNVAGGEYLDFFDVPILKTQPF